jgi:hypothetical protein
MSNSRWHQVKNKVSTLFERKPSFKFYDRFCWISLKGPLSPQRLIKWAEGVSGLGKQVISPHLLVTFFMALIPAPTFYFFQLRKFFFFLSWV